MKPKGKVSVFLLISAIVSGAGFSAHAVEQEETFSQEVTSIVKYKYLVILPDEYRPEDKYPLVLFLHGAGERGDDLAAVKRHGPFETMKKLKLGAILVAPQCPEGEVWNPAVLAGLLDQVEDAYRIDRSRIYLTGLSMGGFGTWSLAAFQPDRFAAIAPICGGGNPEHASRLVKIPIWAFHGDRDQVVTLETGKTMVDAVEKAGGKPRFTVYPRVTHDSWTRTYNNPEFYEWLFAQVR